MATFVVLVSGGLQLSKRIRSFNIHGVLVQVSFDAASEPLGVQLEGDFGAFEASATARPHLRFDLVASTTLGDEPSRLALDGSAVRFEYDVRCDARQLWLTALRPSFTPRITDLMLARGNVLQVHASAAASEDRAVALIGERGAGKSSLCYLLVRNGWSYLSNDLVYLEAASEKMRCLGLPQEVTLGVAARLAFESPFSPGVGDDLRRLHGSDPLTKASLRHDMSKVRLRADLSALLFPEPALHLAQPRARQLDHAEVFQKLLANTQSPVRWGFSPCTGADVYMRAIDEVANKGIARTPAYLFQWTCDHNANLTLMRELLG